MGKVIPFPKAPRQDWRTGVAELGRLLRSRAQATDFRMKLWGDEFGLQSDALYERGYRDALQYGAEQLSTVPKLTIAVEGLEDEVESMLRQSYLLGFRLGMQVANGHLR